MRRPLVVMAAIVAGLMTITRPAQAKFVVRVVIDGLGLAERIELPNTTVRVGCTFFTACHPDASPPGSGLGPRYSVTQWLEGHTPRGPMMDPILHDLYPYAHEGAWVFTRPGQTWHDWNRIRRVPSGWTPADPWLMKALRAHGLPSERPVERIVAATMAAPEPRETRSGMVGALVGVGVLMAGGRILVRPLWRRRSPGG